MNKYVPLKVTIHSKAGSVSGERPGLIHPISSNASSKNGSSSYSQEMEDKLPDDENPSKVVKNLLAQEKFIMSQKDKGVR